MGMFMDDASHATDFIHWMLGKPTSVIAEIDNILTDVAPDDTGLAVYRFAGGEMAILLNTSVTLAGENTTEIYGDEGVVIQNYGDAPSCNIPRPTDAIALKLYTRDEPSWKDLGIPIPDGHGERIGGVPRPFIDCSEERNRTRCHGGRWTGFSRDDFRGVPLGTGGTARYIPVVKRGV